jgi:TonB family protein
MLTSMFARSYRAGLYRLGLVLPLLLLAVGVAAQTDQQQRPVKNVVQPAVPDLAKRLNIKGTVRIEVTIATDGTVKRTRVLGGSPVLAVEAERAAQRTTFQSGPQETTQVMAFTF